MDSDTRHIAIQRVKTLFRLANEATGKDPRLAQRYVDVARRIAMGARLRLSQEHRRQVCRHCKAFVHPGLNCRIRTRGRREPHVVATCLNCGRHLRIPLRTKKEKQRI